MHMEDTIHKCLQSCVGTRARLGYATFDVQLLKAYFVIFCHYYTVHYLLRLCRLSTHMLYRGSGGMPPVFAAGPRDMSTHDLKPPGQCLGMLGPACAYDTIYSKLLPYHPQAHSHYSALSDLLCYY